MHFVVGHKFQIYILCILSHGLYIVIIRLLPAQKLTWKLNVCCFAVTSLQVVSSNDVILRCLFDFAGQEGDELTIQANQVSGVLYYSTRRFTFGVETNAGGGNYRH